MLNTGQAMILDGFPERFRPTARLIDDWGKNRRLGVLFEAQVAGGKLLVCSLDINGNLESRPAARQLRHSLLQYAASETFAPTDTLELAAVKPLFARPELKVVHVDSEARGYEGRLATDGEPNTLWHTPWTGTPPKFPHEIQIRLKKDTKVRGLRYLPRQDMSNGWISRYRVYVSEDGEDWGRPVARGRLEPGKHMQDLAFRAPSTCRYIRFVALSSVEGNPFAAIAELGILTD